MERIDCHNHTHYSNIRLLDSINRPKDLINYAIELGLSGIAITDHECLSGHPEANLYQFELQKEHPNFKVILGNEIYLVDERPSTAHYHFILLAKDLKGHKQLRQLSSRAWMNSYFARGMERVDTLKSDIEEIVGANPGHLIASTACLGGELDVAILQLIYSEKMGLTDEVKLCKNKIGNFLTWGKNLFGEDFYIECQPGVSNEQVIVNKRLVSIAQFFNIKMIVTCDSHYLKAEDRAIHKSYLNSKEGEREVDAFYADAYLHSNQEMYTKLSASEFSQEFVDQMFANSMEIYNKIENYSLAHKQTIPKVEVKNYPKVLPKDSQFKEKYPILSQMSNSEDDVERYWYNECINKLHQLNLYNDQYLSRLEEEADVKKVISEKLETNMFSYPVTLQHYVDLFWDCGSLVGAGRGSSCSGLNHYLLGITQLDPIKWDLPFFRYLNKERVELGDIDLDLCPSKRPKILNEIKKERGSKFNSQIDNLSRQNLGCTLIATFGTEGGRSAVLTACRGYRTKEYPNGIDVDVGQYISSLIPQERGFLWPIKDVVYGNEDKDRQPISAFVNEVNKYPGLLDIMLGIEGLINKRSSHASGVILFDEDPYEFGCFMRTPKGEIITQYDLHMCEACGMTKYDFLVTVVQDRLVETIKLLQKYNEIDAGFTLREVYDKYFHPNVLPLNDKNVWKALSENSVLDIFQFDSEVGSQAAKKINPQNILEMSDANGLMRLMTAEKGAETPMDKYVRFKNNIDLWYQEMTNFGLTKEEQKVLEPYFLSSYGVPPSQEQLMKMLMDENICHFTLKEANDARKIVGKKQMNKIPALKEKVLEQAASPKLGEYVWTYGAGPQMGYSFSIIHALAYSFIGFQTLYIATNWNPVFWNTACLIVDSGSLEEDEVEIVDIYEEEDQDEYDYEDLPDRSGKKKIKKAVAYDKIATAIGKMTQRGIKVNPPDINKAGYGFAPDLENNAIIFGIKGIAKINNELAQLIIDNRPYSSIKDFVERVKINKIPMINLIKSGCFDTLEKIDREQIMYNYIDSISDKKQKLTLQNMNMLINNNCLPAEFHDEIQTYKFNKYLKELKSGIYYKLDERALNYFEKRYNMDLIKQDDNGDFLINQKDWDKIYKKEMEIVKEALKDNPNILADLNNKLFLEQWNKYAQGSISKWEMDSVSYYSHAHELATIDKETYGISDFFSLNEEPEIDKIWTTKDGKDIPIYKIYRICGTVIGKDKAKNNVTLLTEQGVVQVKIYRSQFAKYDKQISVKDEQTGKKTILEKSWFSRGNKIMFAGIRRGDLFVPKVYKNSQFEFPVELITQLYEDGTIEVAGDRLE